MKRVGWWRTLAICVALALGACSATSPAGKAVVSTVAFTTEDLTAAKKLSAAAGDPDHGDECVSWLIAQQPAIQAALAPATPATVSGVFSALEASNLAANTVRAGISPALRSAAESNCGPYFMNLSGSLNALLLKVGLSALPIVP